ncbi:MAG: ABC transporter permease [Candidatus Omnitrophica bacterium]|nr:ABC transporter permease [Candidatus Omnitrophota bacterium]
MPTTIKPLTILGFERSDFRLIVNLFKMNLKDRYTGSLLGIYWALINPLVQLSIYTFVFGFVLKSKIPGSDSTFHYVLWLISGIIPWLAISESLSLSANSVIQGSGLVKNIVFKSECLPLASVFVSCVPFAVGMTFLALLFVATGNFPGTSIIYLPFVIMLQLFFLTGVSFFLSAATVFVRDIGPFLISFLFVVFFATPIFYPVEMMPSWAEIVTYANPFYQIIKSYRDILIDHLNPNVTGLLYLFVLGVGLNVFGIKFFRICKGLFESAL